MISLTNQVNYDIILYYLSDNRRFADLFNGICFRGETVIRAEDLLEGSQVYHETTGEVRRKGRGTDRRERIRDICKLLKSGETLRVLALENQEMIDYTMPLRCMQYDVMEYGKQLDALKKKKKRESFGRHS